ncbi:MAG: Asp-tRNA(Asn)/Glu-tRNA(Gln) amidotransferase subunit GatB [Erysipelotrichaceae bacterium]|nr:Asp-tRNA(Asn)/Glu-tRNA(Gln) amidotransferase subunit GatB [Erysipelotrichaceae bacterium]
MKYETVIGIEIHCELKTKTKMFSSAPVSFAKQPNSCVNVIDLGHPGTLPCLNKEAVRMAIKACTALNMSIEPLVRFDRKNYYYSDLPKGFQITQQFHPIGSNGFLEIKTDDGIKNIRIERLHMEEDTAKQFHNDFGTMIDYNRAGTPLVEIVSCPDMRSGKEAAAYVEKLRSILYYLDVSDVKMEEGSMRCDVNISLRPEGSEVFGTKCEIKNLNSISNVQKAIEFEIERQSKILDEGGSVKQETRRFDEAKKETVSMRSKEGSVDYKYFPEPNITPILLSEEFIQGAIDTMPELPDSLLRRLTEDYGIGETEANILISTREEIAYFDAVMKHSKNAKLVCNWILGDVSGVINKMNLDFGRCPIKPESLAELIAMIEAKEISSKQAKEVFEAMVEGAEPREYVKEHNMAQNSDTGALTALVNEVLDENEQSIIDFKAGKDRAAKFLVGQSMKKSKGTANPQMANEILMQELAKR